MKTIIINKRDLKNKNYSNSKVIIEDRDEPNINMDNELADFLFSCFKVMRETKESLDTSKTIGFILSMPKTIVKESICLNIIVLKEDLETMKENIVKFIIKALKQINRSFYTIEEIALNIVEQAEDSLDCIIETDCNKIIKVGA
ncbi:MAG: hypothetical protein KA384_08935 [Leptotrichiaceae bacterium]|jgi:hypothetical protein|nr:hypothetical protein [Leptotrichiaceae bacterium]